MALQPGAAGQTSRAYHHRYGWREQALYALGIGAKRAELAYLYEAHPEGMRVFPTYAVVPAFEPVVALLTAAGVDLGAVVHRGQLVRLHAPLPIEGEIETVGRLEAIYDLKRLAELVISTRTTLAGEPLYETEWSILVRGAGGFGGDRPPPRQIPKPDKGREPDWTVLEATSEEQALLYRLSGDTNPLHADPAMAARAGFDAPILHGLCTYGFMARALVARSAGGDAGRLRLLSAQFRKPVWPGDRLQTSGWECGGGVVALRVTVEGRAEPVVTGAWAEIGS